MESRGERVQWPAALQTTTAAAATRLCGQLLGNVAGQDGVLNVLKLFNQIKVQEASEEGSLEVTFIYIWALNKDCKQGLGFTEYVLG